MAAGDEWMARGLVAKLLEEADSRGGAKAVGYHELARCIVIQVLRAVETAPATAEPVQAPTIKESLTVAAQAQRLTEPSLEALTYHNEQMKLMGLDKGAVSLWAYNGRGEALDEAREECERLRQVAREAADAATALQREVLALRQRAIEAEARAPISDRQIRPEVPLAIIDAINCATGSNEWQGEFSPADLLGPACVAIQDLSAVASASQRDSLVRKLIETRDTLGWCRETDDAINALRAGAER